MMQPEISIVRFIILIVTASVVTVCSYPQKITDLNYIHDQNSIQQNEKILKLFVRLAAHTANRLLRLKIKENQSRGGQEISEIEFPIPEESGEEFMPLDANNPDQRLINPDKGPENYENPGILRDKTDSRIKSKFDDADLGGKNTETLLESDLKNGGNSDPPISEVEVENRALFNIEKNNYVTHYADQSTNINRADTTVNNIHNGGGTSSSNVIVNQEAGSKSVGGEKLFFLDDKSDFKFNNFGHRLSASDLAIDNSAGSSGSSSNIASLDQSWNENEAKTSYGNSFEKNLAGSVRVNQNAGSSGIMQQLDQSSNRNHAETIVSDSNSAAADTSASLKLQKNFGVEIGNSMGRISDTVSSDSHNQLVAAGESGSTDLEDLHQLAGRQEIGQSVAKSGLEIGKKMAIGLNHDEQKSSLVSTRQEGGISNGLNTSGRETSIQGSLAANSGSNFDAFNHGVSHESQKVFQSESKRQQSMMESQRQQESNEFKSAQSAQGLPIANGAFYQEKSGHAVNTDLQKSVSSDFSKKTKHSFETGSLDIGKKIESSLDHDRMEIAHSNEGQLHTGNSIQGSISAAGNIQTGQSSESKFEAGKSLAVGIGHILNAKVNLFHEAIKPKASFGGKLNLSAQLGAAS